MGSTARFPLADADRPRTLRSIVGRISMDLTLVDVTGIAEVSVGDEVVLLGSSMV